MLILVSLVSALRESPVTQETLANHSHKKQKHRRLKTVTQDCNMDPVEEEEKQIYNSINDADSAIRHVALDNSKRFNANFVKLDEAQKVVT